MTSILLQQNEEEELYTDCVGFAIDAEQLYARVQSSSRSMLKT